MKQLLTTMARIIVAITFIFSGFVKLVDPIGSAIKFTEYFSEDVLNLPALIPYALPFSILLILTELLLGIALLIAFKPKLTVWATTLLLLVFLFLTWYSAYYDKVTDCGCFGDAVKLSPWGTFYKNIVLGVLLLWLLFNVDKIKAWFSLKITNWIPFVALIAGLYISYYVLNHLPIIDFRPFSIGSSIPKGMEYIDGEDIPKIHDFILENDTDDLTQTILEAPKVLLFISYNLNESDIDSFKQLKPLAEKALDKNYLVYLLSASSMDDFQTIRDVYNLPFEMLYGDETMLKTIIRANPGIVVLNKGVVTQKWNWKDYKKIHIN